MSFAVLLISLLFAAIETLVSWLLLAFEPAAQLLNNVSSIVTTGAIFGIGMALTFAIIFIVGSMHVSKNAASFVQEHAGRTASLGALSVVAVLVVSILGEMLYQAQPLPQRSRPQQTDICFALDFSWSMSLQANVYEDNALLAIKIDTARDAAAGKSAYAAGEDVVYEIEVYNFSDQTAYDVSVDYLLTGESLDIGTLTPKTGRTLEARYTMTAEDARDDFHFVVAAHYSRNQGSAPADVETVQYKLSFLHHAEESGVTKELYRIVDNFVSRADNLKAALADTLQQMSDEQRVSVIFYRNEPKLVTDWTELTPQSRSWISGQISQEEPLEQTNFARALAMADRQVAKALKEGRRVAVIMISDGEDKTFRSTADSAPTILANGVRVNTLIISDEESAASLETIARETGGQFKKTTSELTDLTQTMIDAVEEIKAVEQTAASSVPDTLITERYVSRRTIINARVLRILILFLIGFFFKIIAVICIGNNQRSIAPHMMKAILIGAFTALWVEFGYAWGLPLLLVIAVYWTLLMGQIVTRH